MTAARVLTETVTIPVPGALPMAGYLASPDTLEPGGGCWWEWSCSASARTSATSASVSPGSATSPSPPTSTTAAPRASNRLINLKTARLADMDLTMRVTQHIRRPAAAFVYPAGW